MERRKREFRYGPKATELVHRGDLPLCAKSGHYTVPQIAAYSITSSARGAQRLIARLARDDHFRLPGDRGALPLLPNLESTCVDVKISLVRQIANAERYM